MSAKQMTAVYVTATQHVVGLVFANGNASQAKPPSVDQIVGKDGCLIREGGTGRDLFKVPLSELSTAVVAYNASAFSGAALAPAGKTKQISYRVVAPPGSMPGNPIASGTVAAMATSSDLSGKPFTITASGIQAAITDPLAGPTAVWIVLYGAPDVVLVGSGHVGADGKGMITLTPSNPNISVTYDAVVALVAGFIPRYVASATGSF